MTDAILRTAKLAGPDDRFRYELGRRWDFSLPALVTCMLNPSTADHRKDDPTILALMHFARAWGYGAVSVVNLFALRTSHPKDLLQHEDRLGPEKGAHIDAALRQAQEAGRLLAAWGTGGDLDGRAEWFCARACHVYHVDLVCLGTTKDWHPKHPLARGKHRIARDQRPVVWREGRIAA